MNDLLSELEVVVERVNAATPNTWAVGPYGGIHKMDGDKFGVALLAGESKSGLYENRAANEAAASTAVNFIRAHHAEIAAAVRDAERWRAARNNTGDGLRLIRWTHNAPEKEQVMFPSPNLCDDYADAAMRQEGE